MILQAEPARRLANLAKVPIAVVSGEASVFRFTDGPLVEFLKQAGCNAVHIELAARGVHGNSHGSMFERNNAEVLAVVTDWMDRPTGLAAHCSRTVTTSARAARRWVRPMCS